MIFEISCLKRACRIEKLYAHPTLHLKGDDDQADDRDGDRGDDRACDQADYRDGDRDDDRDDDEKEEAGHLDQFPAHSVLHLEHVEEGVDKVLLNLVVNNWTINVDF